MYVLSVVTHYAELVPRFCLSFISPAGSIPRMMEANTPIHRSGGEARWIKIDLALSNS